MGYYYKSRDDLVSDIKRVGKTIIEKADEIVGDWDGVTEFKIIVEISVDTIPCLSWQTSARVLPTQINGTNIKEN